MSKRYLLFTPVILFLFVFGVYLTTAASTIAPDDSGELVSAAYGLGVAHPPGYPLYTLFTSLFTRLPLGPIAWRANLASLTAIALAMMVLFFLMRASHFGYTVSLSGALTAAFLVTVWRQAVISEVYALTLFLALCVIWLAFSGKSWHLTVFIWGLSLIGHYQSLFLFPLIFWKLANNHRKLLVGLLLLCLTGGLFSYLPIRAARSPNLNWGKADNLTNFSAQVTRLQYKEVKQKRTLAGLLAQVGYFGRIVSGELPLYLVWLAVPGIYYLFKRSREKTIIWLSLFAVYLLFTGAALNYPTLTRALHLGPKFYLLDQLIILIWVFAGLRYLLDLTSSKWLSVGLLAVPLIFIGRNFQESDFSHYHLALDYAHRVLETPVDRGKLFLREDFEIFPVVYASLVEGKRPDLAVFDFNREPFQPVFENLDGDKIYNQSFNYQSINQALTLGYPFYLAVLTRRITVPTTFAGLLYSALPGLNLKSVHRPFRFEEKFADYASRYLASRYYLSLAAGSTGRRGEELLAKSSALAFDIGPIHRELARNFERLGLARKAFNEMSLAFKLEGQGL